MQTFGRATPSVTRCARATSLREGGKRSLLFFFLHPIPQLPEQGLGDDGFHGDALAGVLAGEDLGLLVELLDPAALGIGKQEFAVMQATVQGGLDEP